MEHPFLEPGKEVTYSYSKLSSYATCPAKLLFRRLDLPKEPSIAAEYGSAAHRHFEARLKEEPNAFDAAHEYLKENVYDKYPGKTLDEYRDQMVDAAADMDRSIKSWEKDCFPKIVGKLDDPEKQVEMSVEMPYRLGRFVGKIDLFFKQRVHDWKTGRVASQEDCKKSPQGGLYVKMLRHVGVAVDQVVFVYTKGVNIATKIAKSGKNIGKPIPDKENPVYIPTYRYADWPEEKVEAMMVNTIDPLAEQYETGIVDKRGKLILGACSMCEYRKVCDDYTLPTLIDGPQKEA